MIGFILNSRIGRMALAIGGAILAVVTFGAWQRHKGRKDLLAEQEIKDQKEADDVRNKVDDALDDVHDVSPVDWLRNHGHLREGDEG